MKYKIKDIKDIMIENCWVKIRILSIKYRLKIKIKKWFKVTKILLIIKINNI